MPNERAISMATAKTIAFINYKGGVAKTTSTYHIGCWLAGSKSKRVLLVDIDPQTNLTFLCASIEKWKKRKSKIGTIATVYKRYLDRKPLEVKKYIWKTPIVVLGQPHPRLDLIPCDIDLLGEDVGGGRVAGTYPSMEMLRKNTDQFMRDREFLSTSLREVRDSYDYILIDCPPNLYLMTQNALVASDHYVVTAIPDHLSTIGLNILRQKVEAIGKTVRHAGALAGRRDGTAGVAAFGAVLFVRVRIGGSMLTSAHAAIMADVRTEVGPDRCFATHTTELIGYTEAAERSCPVWFRGTENSRRATAKNEYPRIVDEFLEKF